MKLNKRGVTLMELLISVGLMATVLLFLFNLLINLQYNTKHNSYAKKNQVNRMTIIKTIQDDFIDKGVKINSLATGFDANHRLVIYFDDNTNKTLEVNETYIKYGNEKWLISRENNSIKYDVNNLRIIKSSNANTYQFIKIVIPVNTESNLDDLELFYVGKIS